MRDDTTTDPDRLEAQLAAWARGIGDELHFWDAWLGSRGLQWPEDFSRRMDPEAPLDARMADLARRLGQERVRILDVGAGPVTILGYRLPGVALEITATDALAPLYAALLERHGVTPPIATRFAPAEDLSMLFPVGGFDLVHCRNALDHSFDPLRGIEEMLAVVREGGFVLLSHFRNEAENGQYNGLHQWNFDLREGRFTIWNRGGAVDVATALRCPCRLTCHGEGGGVEVLIEKTGKAPPASEAALRGRLARYLEAFVRVLGAQQLPAAGPAQAGH
ncbi:MAG: methyltransferase domain-containing protein [Acetobacteraceae bacterium]|nr:methyltransferase domain-containing protein [Acetobacteraceae bacterium]